MAITIREEQDGFSSDAGNQSFTLTTAQIGDLVLLVQADNFFTLANLITPTGTAVTTWTERTGTGVPVDGGTNDHHARVWTGVVTTAGGTAIANRTDTQDEGYAAFFVLANAVFDGTAGTESDSASTSHVAPSLTPTPGKTDDLLVCLVGAGNAADFNYTFPGGMTAYTERELVNVITYRVASEQLAADTATGTRTATASASVGSIGWFALSVLIGQAAPPPEGPHNSSAIDRMGLNLAY